MAWGWFDHKRSDTSPEWTGFLEQGVKIEGKLESSGTFRIDSALKGTVVSRETLILGEHAAVEGEIDGNNIIIAGRFDGTIHAAKKVEIQPKAIVTGHIHAPCIIIEPGAVFEGQCHMPSSTEGAQPTVIAVRSAVTQT
jgi:cytoskeletal protein CcmA (bactofilin family)